MGLQDAIHTRRTAEGSEAGEDGPRQPALNVAKPRTRPLKAYAFDPSRGRLLGNQMSMQIRYEELEPGPVVKDCIAGTESPSSTTTPRTTSTTSRWISTIHAVLIRGGLDP